ncbi:MAG: hypothetical protein L6300_14265, partial [Syntrophaceae bacterium]|nr:hypothetical protein [Pseudomonadota bacterium]MCG2741378.1 hypothetical protein [Syntrophaceae bacterium]
MDIGIPRVFGVAVDRISVCLKLKIASGAFMGTRCGIMSPKSPKLWTAMTAPGMGSRGHLAARCPHRILDKDFQGFPGTAAEIGKKLPIVEKVTAEDFWD